MMVGNFNTNMAAPEGHERYRGIAAALEEEGLEDMSGHFLPRHNPWLKYGRTWAMYWVIREVRSRTYYIMSTNSHMFQNVAVR